MSPSSKKIPANAVSPPPADVPLLTFGEAAYLLRVGVTTVRRAVDGGQLRTVRLRDRTLIARQAIDDFIRLADLAKVPTSDQVARLSEPLKAGSRPARAVAVWDTGADLINLAGRGRAGRPGTPGSRNTPGGD